MHVSMAVARRKLPGKLEKKKFVSLKDRFRFVFFGTTFYRVVKRVPVVILLLVLLYVWLISSDTFHICVSSRKLSNLYCLSAGDGLGFSHPVESHAPLTSFHNVGENSSFINNQHGRVNNGNETLILIKSKEQLGNARVEKPGDKSEEEKVAEAMKNLHDILALQRSWAMPESRKKAGDGDTCGGKGVYVYDLPSKFNKDLMSECRNISLRGDFCSFFRNNGLGPPVDRYGDGWFETHQYSLEPIFHSRILNYPCRVLDESQAVLFYVPYYGGLDVLRWHFKNVPLEMKDSLGQELVEWLRSKDAWNRNSGRDHVFVLGKVSWDFRRRDGMTWGSKFLESEEMQNPLKLLIEREPWRVNEIGVPHPTYFHPSSDADIVAWQEKIIGAKRRNLVGFAGAARPMHPHSIRSILIKQCNDPGKFDKCRHIDCQGGGCAKPESIIDLFLDSEFCLQPPGDSPTRKSIFDSLISGCIPVLFNFFSAYYQYAWHLPVNHSAYSVHVSREDLMEKKGNVIDMLTRVPPYQREGMRRFIAYELMPKLVYGTPEAKFYKFEDAFMLSMNNLLEKVTTIED